MTTQAVSRIQLFNAIGSAIGWAMVLLFAIGNTAYRMLRSEQMGAVDFVMPCLLALVAMVLMRRYIHLRSLYKVAAESEVRVPPGNRPGRHLGTETITGSQLLFSLATTIGWWLALLFSVAYAASNLQHNVHMGMALLFIPFALLLVVIRSTRRYIHFRSLRKAGEEAGER